MRTAEDLAAKLRVFALDSIVVKHLIEFALPSKKQESQQNSQQRELQLQQEDEALDKVMLQSTPKLTGATVKRQTINAKP